MEATYGIIELKDDLSKTAIIEMSAAAGITLVPEESRNPMNTTTFGVGELILDAIERGCRHFIVGIGGSATNDGGVGMLQALGYDFVTREGKSISYGGNGLRELASIKETNVHPKLKECTFKVACDVTNPLCGENGSSAILVHKKEQLLKWFKNWINYYYTMLNCLRALILMQIDFILEQGQLVVWDLHF